MQKRLFLHTVLALSASAGLATAQTQAHAATPLKFQLDWRFEGPAAFFLQPVAKGYFKVAGDVDSLTGFTFPSLLNLEARGIKAADVVVMPYADFGVKLYGNAIIASPKLIKENPAAIKAFLQAFAKGAKEVIANPGAAIA